MALGTRFTWYERVKNLVKYVHTYYKTNWMINEEAKIFHDVYPNMPDMHELVRKQSLLFINSHPLLDIPRQYSGKIQFIGGIHMTKRKVERLPAEYLQLFDESEKLGSKSTSYFSLSDSIPESIVLVSLGSVVKMSVTPLHVRHAFFNAFGSLQNYTFIWAHDNPELDSNISSKYPNIHLRKWLPQKQLLADPRVKLFLTHMGLNSYIELAYTGVPVVALPLIIDQHFNTGIAVQKRLGVMLDKFGVTMESVKQAVLKVAENEE